MTSRMSTPRALGSDAELSIVPPLSEDEMTTAMHHVRRNSDVFARQIIDDATPEAITDEEPTVPIHFRSPGLHAVHPRPVR